MRIAEILASLDILFINSGFLLLFERPGLQRDPRTGRTRNKGDLPANRAGSRFNNDAAAEFCDS